jgi:2-dehydropantoate 2-reductase
MTDSKNSILIAGTGAMANLFAARLARSGVRVTMIGTWLEGLAALRENGVRLVDARGREQAFPIQVAMDPLDCTPASLVLVLVKAWQTKRAAEQLARCLAPDGLALTLQNGLGNLEILGDRLGPDRVALGTTTSGATLLGPGLVRAGGEGAISVEDDFRLAPILHMLHLAQFKIKTVADLDALVWGKLAINAAINPLSALLRVPNGELLERPTARELMAAAAWETAHVAAAQGIRLPFDDPAAAAEAVAERTAANRSSMFQDIRRGAPTEIDAINGAIVRAGERFLVATPTNRVLWQLVKALVHTQGASPTVSSSTAVLRHLSRQVQELNS